MLYNKLCNKQQVSQQVGQLVSEQVRTNPQLIEVMESDT